MTATKPTLILTRQDFMQVYVPEVVKIKEKHIQGQKAAIK